MLSPGDLVDLLDSGDYADEEVLPTLAVWLPELNELEKLAARLSHTPGVDLTDAWHGRGSFSIPGIRELVDVVLDAGSREVPELFAERVTQDVVRRWIRTALVDPAWPLMGRRIDGAA